MERTVFKPRYSFGYWAELLFEILFMVIIGISILNATSLSLIHYIFLTLFLILVISKVGAHVKKISFEGRLLIEYYFLPRKEFEYSEITDLGEYVLKCDKFQLSLSDWGNRTAFLNMLNHIIIHGGYRHQIEGKVLQFESLGKKVAAISFLVSLALMMTLPLILKFFWEIDVSIILTFEWSFILTFGIVMLILKMRDNLS